MVFNSVFRKLLFHRVIQVNSILGFTKHHFTSRQILSTVLRSFRLGLKASFRVLFIFFQGFGPKSKKRGFDLM